MIITLKRHKRIIERKNEILNDYLSKNYKLEQELTEARNLKQLLNKFADKLEVCSGSSISYADLELQLSDAIPRYVDDMLGGKVIKQEATKVIKILHDGTVQTGLTKQPADKGYSYKLIRI